MDDASRRNTILGYMAIIASAVCTGATWPILKDVLGYVEPLQANLLYILPALVVVGLIYSLRRRGQSFLPTGAHFGWLLLFASFASVIFYTKSLGVDLTTATTGALVIRLELAIVFVLSYVVLKTRVTAAGWVGTVLLFLGTMSALGVSFGDLTFAPLGIAALIIAAVLTAGNAIIIKLHFGKLPSEMPALASCVCQTLFFSIILLSTGKFTATFASLANPRVAIEALILGLLTAGSLILYYFSMKRIPMWTCRILSLIGPVVAVLGDHFWLGTVITRGQLIGLTTVLCGATLVIISSRENGRTPASD